MEKNIKENEEQEVVDSIADDTDSTRLSIDSVDDQIDSMIIDFESYSVGRSDAMMESLANFNLSALLTEQDAPEGDLEDTPQDDEGADDPQPEEKRKKPEIDMDAFTNRVARLAKNYEVLLDVKTVVVNRAILFLQENYEKEEIDEFKEILDSQFDFNLSGPPEVPEAPLAVGAGGPGGGLGGGS